MMHITNCRELPVSVYLYLCWDFFFFFRSRHRMRKAKNTGKKLQGNASQPVNGFLQFTSGRAVLNIKLLGKQEVTP